MNILHQLTFKADMNPQNDIMSQLTKERLAISLELAGVKAHHVKASTYVYVTKANKLIIANGIDASNPPDDQAIPGITLGSQDGMLKYLRKHLPRPLAARVYRNR